MLCRAGRAATRAVRRVHLRVLTFLAAAPAGSPPSTILPRMLTRVLCHLPLLHGIQYKIEMAEEFYYLTSHTPDACKG